MPPPSPAQRQLIRDYEPILFFHPEERFFPSDAKRYLEQCALWKASAPFENNAQWGTTPVVAAGQLGAIDGEALVFLGQGPAGGPPDFLQTPPDKECFLDMAGWKPAGTPFPPADGYTNVDRIAERYRNETALNKSQFWYHAEFFDKARLTTLFGLAGGNNFLDLFAAAGGRPPKLNDAALICYYLFFPGHDEGLGGCAGVPEAAEYASFAGEWACVAVVLDRPPASPDYAPKWVGLTNRNTGIIQFNGNEVRVGMRLFSWSATDGTHVRVQVAKGSHALYLPNQVPASVVPLTQVDPSAGSCGLAALPAGSTSELVDTYGGAAAGTIIAKMEAGAAAGGLFGPFAGAGLLAGFVWALAEGDDIPGYETVTTVTVPPPSLSPTVDLVSTAGKVVHPKGLPPPDIDPANAIEWRSDDNVVLPVQSGGTTHYRRYDSTVIRETQIIWPDDKDPNANGYTGRWGPRVTSATGTADLSLRRAGMKFPTFWYMVFDLLVRADPPPIVVPLPPGTSWTVPVDWNNNNNSIETLGGGGGGGGGGGASDTPGNSGGGAGGGGGGGGYSRITNFPLEPGQVVTYQIGTAGSPGMGGPATVDGSAGGAGGDTWFNGNDLTTASVGSKGGTGGGGGINGDGDTTGGGGGDGGAAESGAGEAKNSGGAGGGGGASSPTASGGGGGGGGGAAGAAGNGIDGAGGEDNGGESGAGGSGDADQGGSGGALVAANTDGSPGDAGTEWKPTHGSGGGGGGAGSGGPGRNGGAAGLYGAGGGGGGGGDYISQVGGNGASGQPGLIIISYTP